MTSQVRKEVAPDDSARLGPEEDYLVYREGQVNRCPACDRTHWYVGRHSAECGFCGTALRLETPGKSVAGVSDRPHPQRASLLLVAPPIWMPLELSRSLMEKAAERNLSVGDYIESAVKYFEKSPADEEAELKEAVARAHVALTQMNRSLDHSIASLDATHEKVDALLRQAGVRN